MTYSLLHIGCVLRLAACLTLAALTVTARADDAKDPAALSTEALRSRLQSGYSALAVELASICPIAAPGDRTAFDQCRQALFGDSLLRRSLLPIVLWGRARGQALKDTPLTQFAPDVYTGLYAPLFMFEGTAQVAFDEDENLYKATLPARFRNRLAPGLFPYPFWHDKTKWSSYQSTVALNIYIDPATEKIKVVQFQPGAIPEDVAFKAASAASAFDGKWLWTDASGHTQPEVTLFDGLYRADNPYLQSIETTYQALAIELRQGECSACHAPDNAQRLKRLVLLQTPAHAAGEIKRILKSVKEDKMPLDDFGIEKRLPSELKVRLLARAQAFDDVLTSARTWENEHAAAERP